MLGNRGKLKWWKGVLVKDVLIGVNGWKERGKRGVMCFGNWMGVWGGMLGENGEWGVGVVSGGLRGR